MMPELTEDQARALADKFLKASEAVSDYRFQNGATLSSEVVLTLKSLQFKLANQSDDFTALAIKLTLQDLEQTVAQIVKITGQARDAIATLNDERRAISIAANLVALGEAIAAGNPGGILTAVQNTKSSLSG
jgi:exopolyphosphatase/pppGpp-phosphohydrolase